MISWLKGQIIKNWQITSKKGVVIDVGGVGYEVQLLPKQIDNIITSTKRELWIHQINREDSTILYGFNEDRQRDLFRVIIGISGIGPQIGMSLLEDLEVNELVNAIQENDLKMLIKSPGIGKRTAERLVVELKNKVDQFKDNQEVIPQEKHKLHSTQLTKYFEEIKSILNSLGYMDDEVKDSLELIRLREKEQILLLTSLSEQAKADLMDKHLKEILIKLSEKDT